MACHRLSMHHAIISINRNDPVRIILGQPVAERNKPAVHLALRRGKISRKRKWSRANHRRASRAFQVRQITAIDDQHVVQCLLQRREEADPHRREFFVSQKHAGAEQTRVGPGIIARHAPDVIHQGMCHLMPLSESG